MASVAWLDLNEVIDAFTELGGEAEWPDVRARVTARRGDSYAPYKDWRNFNETMSQHVQQHCANYAKFTGQVLFEKVGPRRFRLAASPVVLPFAVPAPPANYEALLSEATAFEPRGEGHDHRALKEFVANNPQVIGLPLGLKGMTGYRLPSGACVDVLFENGGTWTAVEIKARSSPDGDILRGMFQCIKYQAVIEAYQTSRELPPDAHAILVLETPLPQALGRLKDLLSVSVIDRVSPRR